MNINEVKKKTTRKNLSQSLVQGRIGELTASVAMETSSVVRMFSLFLSRAESLEGR